MPFRRRTRRIAFAVGATLWLGLFAYDRLAVSPGDPLAFGIDVTPIDWPFGLSLLIVACFVVPFLYRHGFVGRYWAHARTNVVTVAATTILVLFAAVGLVGPTAVDVLEAVFGITVGTDGSIVALQPPFGLSVPMETVDACRGTVAHGACHGTLAHPLGTNEYGVDLFEGIVRGTRVALAVSLTTVVFVAPLSIGVGIVAATCGGWVDEVAMRLADLTDVVPAVFVYVLVQVPLRGTLVLMVAVFGALSWGRTARVVRSEALTALDSGATDAARVAGGGRWHLARAHVLPNVAGVVFTTATFLVPTLILTEVTLGWLKFSSGYVTSWGDLLGIQTGVYAGTFPLDGLPIATWWTEWPVIAVIFVTVVSFYLVGDALRDVFDPRSAP